MTDAGARSYNLSFTAASLRPELARIIAECFLEEPDWSAVKTRILSSNALQSRSGSSAVRMERELRQRLQTLSPQQIALLAHSTAEDRAAMAWLAMLKYNPLAFDFAAELLRDKLASYDPVLRRSDYESFVNIKAAQHPELASLTPSTEVKLRRVLLRMLGEAGLLVSGSGLGTIQRPLLSPDSVRAIRSDQPRWLAGFLVPDEEIAKP
jgi:hypothetical protein